MSFGNRTSSLRSVDLLVVHGVVITMDPLRTIHYDGSVAIDDGQIIAVGPASVIGAAYVGRESIDARGKAVLPRLIDTHHHFLQNFVKGAPDDLPFPDQWIAAISAPRALPAPCKTTC